MQEDRFGPVDYVVVEFTDPASVKAGFERLLQLVDSHAIRVLDLEFVHSINGVASTVQASRLSPELAQFDGAASGLLDRDDLDTVAAGMAHGTTAAVLVYEDLPMLGVIEAWESGGASVVAEGPVDVEDLAEAVGSDGEDR
ncbi:MAG: hypothetical protein JST91_03720 [Actinobacteria bacterium]|nr:hypothetical protein [Actinomycetota bacterium]